MGPRPRAVARKLLDARQDPETPALNRLPLVTDIVDSVPGSGPVPGRTWSDLVAHQIGQHCAAHFDEWQATWSPEHEHDLFGAWRVDPSVTHGFRWRRGSAWARQQLDSCRKAAIAFVTRILAIRTAFGVIFSCSAAASTFKPSTATSVKA